MTRRALIVKTTSMGDVIHALPAVADLAKAQPDLQIDWVVEKSFADIPRLSRYVNTVHEVAVRQWRKHVLSSQTWREVGRVRAALQSAHYERVVDLQGLLKSAVTVVGVNRFYWVTIKTVLRSPGPAVSTIKPSLSPSRLVPLLVVGCLWGRHLITTSKPIHWILV